jgi:hypothetical protein
MMTVIAYSFWEHPQIWNELEEKFARELAWELRNQQYKVEIMSNEEYFSKIEEE